MFGAIRYAFVENSSAENFVIGTVGCYQGKVKMIQRMIADTASIFQQLGQNCFLIFFIDLIQIKVAFVSIFCHELLHPGIALAGVIPAAGKSNIFSMGQGQKFQFRLLCFFGRGTLNFHGYRVRFFS